MSTSSHISLDLALQQAVAHHQAGRLQEAERLYRAILQAQPNHPDANHNLGILAVQSNQTEAGLPYFQAALTANPDQGQFWLSHIDALLRANQSDAAGQMLERARQRGLRGEAIDILSQRLDVQNAKTLPTPVPALLRQSKKPGAAERKPAAHKKGQPSVDERNQIVTLFNQGRLAEAEALARQMTKQFPHAGFGWKQLGMIFRRCGRSADALAAAQRAVELLPADPAVRNNLGNIFRDLGQLSKADGSFRRALKLAPNMAEAHFNLGALLRYTGDLKDEISAFQSAVRIAPQAIGLDAGVMLAVRHYLAGDIPQCRRQLLASQQISEVREKPVYRAYWNLLDRLLQSTSDGHDADGLPSGAGTLNVLGESHCLPPHRTMVNYRGSPMRCEAQWLMGCKQWHLSDDKKNVYTHKFEKIMAQLPKCATILLLVGEIDCRPEEGILKARKKSPEKSLDALCTTTIGGYLRYVASVGDRYGHNLVIGGVPASTNGANDAVSETIAQHRLLIGAFNTILGGLVRDAKLDFLDLYALTNRGDGFASGAWHLDTFHLVPGALAVAFDKHCVSNHGYGLSV